MITIEVPQNPNCSASGQIVFSPVENNPCAAKAIRVNLEGEDVWCDLVGVSEGPLWVKAHAQKVADSGEGTAYLITGGGWGLRLRPRKSSGEPWGLERPGQWGEAFKLYGNKEDIEYE